MIAHPDRPAIHSLSIHTEIPQSTGQIPSSTSAGSSRRGERRRGTLRRRRGSRRTERASARRAARAAACARGLCGRGAELLSLGAGAPSALRSGLRSCAAGRRSPGGCSRRAACSRCCGVAAWALQACSRLHSHSAKPISQSRDPLKKFKPEKVESTLHDPHP